MRNRIKWVDWSNGDDPSISWAGRHGRRIKRRDHLLVAFLLFLLPVTAWPHPGGLDAHGCHHNRKAGGYHCHRGPLAGQSFASKAEMLRRLEETGAASADSKHSAPIVVSVVRVIEGDTIRV